MSKTIKEQLAEARVAIANTLASEDIQKRMNGFGFTSRRIQEGHALLEKVRLLFDVQEDRYGAFYDSTDAFNGEMEQLRERYRRHRKIALIAYEGNRSMILKLKLRGGSNTITDFIDRAESFYGTLQKDSATIASYGIPPEEIAQSHAMLQALIDVRNRQIAHKGEAQHATRQRNRALKELHDWMSDFRYAARFALRDDPQLLEVVGIRVPTEK